ncbi:aspartate/glutamate racemase family protein [Streptomyces sp. ODS28]|uniref:maleate cis-trans isomerase family protein n=1 Tax=Streptomyces sp. ODS28 TaxID=3136688 RepID=UPI0031EF3BFA
MDISNPRVPPPQRGIGVVAPFDFALDRELWRWVPDEVSLHLTRTPFVPVEVSLDMARLISEHQSLREAVSALHAVGPLSLAYACTSGSFVGGIAQERAMCGAMSAAADGLPAVTTSGALLEALAELGVNRVAVITPYTRSVTDSLEQYLAEGGVQVTGREYLGLTGEIWKVPYAEVEAMAHRAELGEAEALFVSCTNLRTYDLIPRLEAELGIPVVSANQITVWSALRRIGVRAVGAHQSLTDPLARAALLPGRATGSEPHSGHPGEEPPCAVEERPCAVEEPGSGPEAV